MNTALWQAGVNDRAWLNPAQSSSSHSWSVPREYLGGAMCLAQKQYYRFRYDSPRRAARPLSMFTHHSRSSSDLKWLVDWHGSGAHCGQSTICHSLSPALPHEIDGTAGASLAAAADSAPLAPRLRRPRSAALLPAGLLAPPRRRAALALLRRRPPNLRLVADARAVAPERTAHRLLVLGLRRLRPLPVPARVPVVAAAAAAHVRRSRRQHGAAILAGDRRGVGKVDQRSNGAVQALVRAQSHAALGDDLDFEVLRLYCERLLCAVQFHADAIAERHNGSLATVELGAWRRGRPSERGRRPTACRRPRRGAHPAPPRSRRPRAATQAREESQLRHAQHFP